MGGQQTYDVNLKQLDSACLGLGCRYDENCYYFIDEKLGFFSYPKHQYEKFMEESKDDTKTLHLPLNLICKYEWILTTSFDDESYQI